MLMCLCVYVFMCLWILFRNEVRQLQLSAQIAASVASEEIAESGGKNSAADLDTSASMSTTSLKEKV